MLNDPFGVMAMPISRSPGKRWFSSS